MSNRPSLQRKTTRAGKKARDDALDQGLSVTVDGRTYTVRMGDLSSMDAAHLRRETGFSFVGLMRAAAKDPDIDVIAALVWLSRRIDGELLLSFEDVAADIGYDVEFDLADAGDPQEDDRPEA